MNPFAGLTTLGVDAAPGVMIELFLKATVVFGVVASIDRLARRAAAAQRHLLWSAAVVVALMLPLAWAGPRWSLNLLPAPTPGGVTSWRGAAPSTPATPTAPAATAAAGARTTPTVPTPAAPGESAASHAAAWPTVWLALWILGATLALMRVVAGFVALRRLERRARALRDPAWLALAARCASDLGLTRRFTLLRDDATTMPMAWGILRARVLIPAAAEDWTESRRRVVLLHELAHVKRHDCLWQALAQLATALYWFHPGAWYAAARLRSERERACDDEVLRADTRPSEYADHLLDVVRGLRGEPFAPLAAVSFARRRSFEGRLLAVLDPDSRRGPATRKQLGRVGLAAAALGLALAVVQPWSDEAKAGRDSAMEGPPSRLVESAGTGQGLTARWNAAARAAGAGPYWIGYALRDRVDPDHGMLNDSEGIDLETLADDYPAMRLDAALASLRERPNAGDVALLFHVADDGRFDRVRLQSLRIVAILAGQPLHWLGAASDEESFAWLRTLDGRMPTERMKGNLIGLIAIHRNGDAVIPYLASRIRGGESERIRSEAVEGLAHHPSPRSLAILREVARTDRSSHLRREAVETMGRLDLDAATDDLLALARSKQQSVEVRRQAVEALGMKATSKKLEALDQVLAVPGEPGVSEPVGESKHEKPTPSPSGNQEATADDEAEIVELAAYADGDVDVRRQAVESLARYPESVALPRLLGVVRGDEHPDVRRQAVESIGRFDSDRAFYSLVGVAWKDRNPDVARQAVETLGRYSDARSLRTLEEFARKHPVTDVRRQAVEGLSRMDSKRAEAVIDDLIMNDRNPDVQREGIEALRHRPAEVAVAKLQEIVREHPNPEIRRDAVEALGRIDPDAALPVLEELIRGKKSAKSSK
jgi:beta-lactamase regulating signal transducer with metallopeptidase domain/HEAT repeat protein